MLLAIAHGEATARAVASHTGALASDAAAIDAACAAAGIERVRTPAELIDAADGLLRAGPLGGRRIAVLSDGGGHGGIAASLVEEAGLDAPRLSDVLAARAARRPAADRGGRRTRSTSPAAASRTCGRSTARRRRCCARARSTRCC